MFIYKITNIINNKIYIGKQVRNNKKYMGSGVLIKLSISKYGVENFIKEVLEVCESKKELSEREIFWISYYNSQDRNIGYNITKGGEGNSDNKHCIGKKLSESHKKKISDNHHDVSGENNPMYGKTHTLPSKEKISLKRKGVKHNEDTIKLFKTKRLGSKNNNSKLTESDIIQIRTESISGTSLNDLANRFNVKKACIWKIVKGVTWSHI